MSLWKIATSMGGDQVNQHCKTIWQGQHLISWKKVMHLSQSLLYAADPVSRKSVHAVMILAVQGIS